MTPEEKFNQIAIRIANENPDITLGKMMSSPGIKVGKKVFAFYYQNSMGFKLGKDFDPKSFGIMTAKYLNPFKTKPPLKAWQVVDFEEAAFWEELAEMALLFTRSEK